MSIKDLQDQNYPCKIIQTIINFANKHGNLLQKFSQHFFLTYFDRPTINKALVKIQTAQKQLNLQQFVRLFLGIIQHKQQQTLFLAMSLRNIFLKIKDQTPNEQGIKFSDFTNHLCQKIATDDPDIVVPMKQVPKQKMSPDISRIRQIDINPPQIIKNVQSEIPKISKQKKKKDKKLQQNKTIAKFIFSKKNNKILALGRLSSTIHMYDMELNLKNQIIPKNFKQMAKQIAILSMDYCQKSQRIGAIINGVGIVFWQASDKYETQKTISRYYGDKIYYLELFQEWITVDKTTIYFWDIKEETVSRKIVKEDSILINHVCEIKHLRSLCVSYTSSNDTKTLAVYYKNKLVSTYDLGCCGCHTLLYNNATQLIIALGYTSTLNIFEVQSSCKSINLKKTLTGHTSIVTSVCQIQNTNFIITADDFGEARIWELNYMICLQVVKIAKTVGQMYCTGNKLIFADSRLNIMEMDDFKYNKVQQIYSIYTQHDQANQTQIVITRKDFRLMNLNNGKYQKIFVLCNDEEEISSVVKICSGMLLGTSKGMMRLLTYQGKQVWRVTNAHDGQIIQLKYDHLTKFIFSLGLDSKLCIWPEKTCSTDKFKKSISFKSKQMNIMEISPESKLLFVGSTSQKQLSIWDYQSARLYQVLSFSSPLSALHISQKYRCFFAATQNGQISILKYSFSDCSMTIELLFSGNESFSTVKKTKKMTIFEVTEIQNQTTNVKSSKKKLKMKQTMSKGNQWNSKGKVTLTHIQSKIELKTAQKLQKKDTKKSQIELKNSRIFEEELSQSKIQNNTKQIPSINQIEENIQKQKCQFKEIEQGQDDEDQKLMTQKDLKKTSNQCQYITQIRCLVSQEVHYLIVCNTKGNISCLDIASLLNENVQQNKKSKKQSPNMYRPAKQDYDSQLQKKQYHFASVQKMKKVIKIKRSFFKLLWRQNMHKDSLSSIGFIQMRDLYISFGWSDGYCKIVHLNNGILVCSSKMTFPLPIQWDLQVSKIHYIKRNIYQTLVLIDNILTNQGFQMLLKQYQSINITNFLEKLKIQKVKGQLNNKKQDVKLLKQQYTVQDLKGVQQNQTTLKSLQAYKRVKLIKNLDQMKAQRMSEVTDDGIKRIPAAVLRQKQAVQQFLDPNYFPKLIARVADKNNLNKSIQMVNLEEKSMNLLNRLDKKKLKSQHAKMMEPIFPTIQYKKQDKQNETPINFPNKCNKMSYSINVLPSLQKKSSIYTNLQKVKTKRTTLDDKPMKQILNQINSKLSKYKKSTYSKRDY